MHLMEIPQSWKEEFAFAAQLDLDKVREKSRAVVFERQDHDQKEKQKFEEKQRKEAEEAETALANSEQVAAARARFDADDTATIEALMDNGAALDIAHRDINRMLDEAYVLPDGRRVFKAEDGHRVFDERGSAVPSNVIDPGLIDERHAKWEGYKASRDIESRLQGERHDLLEFQTKLDAARARVDKGDMTKRELDALNADLEASMPQSVRQKLDHETPHAGADAKSDANSWRNDAMSANPLAAVTDDPARRIGPRPAPM